MPLQVDQAWLGPRCFIWIQMRLTQSANFAGSSWGQATPAQILFLLFLSLGIKDPLASLVMEFSQASNPSQDNNHTSDLPAFGSKKPRPSSRPAAFPPLSSGVRVMVNDVTPEPLSFKTLDGREHVLRTHKAATGCSHMDTRFVQAYPICPHPLLEAAVLAFQGHHPLEITPDAIFSTIMAGVSGHVNANPERFRSDFVAHEGKMDLKVVDNSLMLGSWENCWDRPVAGLGELVMQNLSNEAACQVLSTGFTTTGPAQSAAHTMTFMDVVKAYFSYAVCTECGIPHIDIAGRKEDWERLASVISPFLIQLDLAGWNEQLQAILRHFVAAFGAKPGEDREFWQGMLKYDGGFESGGQAFVTGWLSQLFPYLRGRVSPAAKIPDGRSGVKVVKAHAYELDSSDDLMISSAGSAHPCIDLCDFPTSVTSTSFIWDYYGTIYKMELVAGIIGVTIGNSGALKPEVGWLVAHAEEG